jgi:DNA-binding Lrp family transcriptional regulator
MRRREKKGEEVGIVWMTTAFVLLNVELGSITDVLKDLKKVEGVDEVYSVYGVHDIIVRVRAKSVDELKEIITDRIRRIDEVRTTLIMLVSE